MSERTEDMLAAIAYYEAAHKPTPADMNILLSTPEDLLPLMAGLIYVIESLATTSGMLTGLTADEFLAVLRRGLIKTAGAA